MAKKDLPKALQDLYFPSAKEPVFVDVPAMQFAMVDGVGDPNSSKGFQEAIGALYGVAYTAKFAAKKTGIRDVLVMPLEGLFWTEGSDTFLPADKGQWHWTLMLMEPAAVTRKLFDGSVRALRERKNPPGLSRVRLERFREGKAAQILYVGPYSAEQPTIERLHAFIRENGYRLSGKHHEIYMGDPRRNAPEKLKTVIRQPASR
ncbi:MAG TPA: GyrI-like domain-containing protein [Thermoplasmata archaeon]|nr:GyrI-like domain-containing protein [Thermoplasmata archaeon]